MRFAPYLLAVALAAQTIPDTHEKLIPTLWVQTSVEFPAAATQAYRLARLNLDQAMRDRKWTAALEQQPGYRKLPPAIILDIDETVLDNSPAQAQQVRAKIGFDGNLWNGWVGDKRAAAIPGAAEFCQYAASKNVAVFFVSNRDGTHREATVKNLLDAGFPLPDPSRLMLRGEKPDWTSEKTTRREAVAKSHRILLLIGDDFGDFAIGVRTTVEKRREMSAANAAKWGREWIVIPNPGYGSWEMALQEPERPQTGLEQLRKKESWLRY